MSKSKFKYIKYIKYIFLAVMLFCIFIKSASAQSVIDKFLTFAENNSTFKIIGKEVTCTAYPKTMEILNDVFKYVKIAAVVLFIVLSSFDYITAITSEEKKDGFKNSNKNLVTRLIVLIAILILPSIINLLLTIIQLNNGNCVIK